MEAVGEVNRVEKKRNPRTGRGLELNAGSETRDGAGESDPGEQRAGCRPGRRPGFAAVSSSFNSTGVGQVDASLVGAQWLASGGHETRTGVKEDNRLLARVGFRGRGERHRW